MITRSNIKFLTLVLGLTVAFTAALCAAVNTAYADNNKSVAVENAKIRVERIQQLSGTEAAREANPQWFTRSCQEGHKMVNETIDKVVADYPETERMFVSLLTKEPTTYNRKDGGCSWGRWTYHNTVTTTQTVTTTYRTASVITYKKTPAKKVGKVTPAMRKKHHDLLVAIGGGK